MPLQNAAVIYCAVEFRCPDRESADLAKESRYQRAEREEPLRSIAE